MKDLSAQAPPTSANREAADLLAAISAVRRTARQTVRKAWRHEPLPPAQGELLRLVADRPGIRVAEAAVELRLAPNTVSTLVGRLSDQGLLARERAVADARLVRLSVTRKARQRIADWRDLRADLAQQAIAQLAPEDRRALSQAVPALLRLAERLALS
ncbi:MAG TPA: MarR family transcriptional regulator [Streptosporangiaceae bacterium]|nr:MarR family transcriptional regulator [Streptosporangiaceae bacterium]